MQHVPFETPAHIADWAAARGHALSMVRAFAGDPFPDLRAVRALVVMGGPMSVNDDARLPWLAAEKRLLGAAMEAGLPVLGICLGAQLVASVAGARVYRHREKELGWFPVHATASGAAHPRFALPAVFDAFHWHGETFDLPDGAVHLARSEACEQQAFAIGGRVLGIQCHLEMTPAAIGAMVEHAAADLAPGPFVQSPARLAGTADGISSAHAILDGLLDRWIEEGVSP